VSRTAANANTRKYWPSAAKQDAEALRRRSARPTKKDQNDGPMLEALKKLQGVSVHLPKRPKDYPDRERLSLRFERFRAAH
jgi:hypothetical protein